MTQAETRSPLFELDPESVRCPFPYYDELNSVSAIAWAPQIESFVVTRYADVVEVLRDTDRFSSSAVAGPINMRQFAETMAVLAEHDPELVPRVEAVTVAVAGSLIFVDPPAHTLQRRLISRAFTVRQVSDLELPVRELCRRLLGHVAGQSDLDVIDSYTAPLPLLVIAHLLGIPEEDFEQFKYWTDMRVSGIGNDNLNADQLRDKMQAEVDQYDYFKGLVEERRRRPTEDLISALANVRDGDDHFDVATSCGILGILLVAGNETVRHLLGSSLRILAGDAQAFKDLRSNRDDIPAFLEEVLRLESPVQGLWRTATRDTMLGGTLIPAGSALYIAYGAANRDPSEFSCPADLSIERKNLRSHVAFSLGQHVCLGAPLARLEARVALNEFFDFYQGATIIDEEIVKSYALRGFEHLWLKVQPSS